MRHVLANRHCIFVPLHPKRHVRIQQNINSPGLANRQSFVEETEDVLGAGAIGCAGPAASLDAEFYRRAPLHRLKQVEYSPWPRGVRTKTAV